MNSTGNDIIALSGINSTRTKQPGFYSKILSTSEQTLYTEPELTAIPFDNFVWLLWSVKESAYKYLQRSAPDLIFSPTKFVVQQLHIPLGYSITHFDQAETESIGFEGVPVIKGTITVGSRILYSRTIIYNELIVSVINGSENFENTYWGIKTVSKPDPIFQSKAARGFLTERLNCVLNVKDLTICKSLHGFPVVTEAGEELAIPVSLSHHNHLVAYSFQSTFKGNKKATS